MTQANFQQGPMHVRRRTGNCWGLLQYNADQLCTAACGLTIRSSHARYAARLSQAFDCAM